MTTETKLAEDVAAWLRTCDGVVVARPCHVTLGNESYEGAYAERVSHYAAGMDCVVRGERTVEDTYRTRYFYLLGRLPKHYAKSPRVAYTLDGVQHEWYIGCYSDPDAKFLATEFYPFGPSFMIFPWEHEDSIDRYERTPYKRVFATVRFED